ncbi:MAG: hypothetical protein KAU31_09555, partial [Spirochaetaceae bacterium]|nr:hypothetical protein [Spirochaetaceae bacterium]
CGPSREWTHDAINSPWLRGVNYGNPEQQNLSELSTFWREKKIPNLFWGDSLCGQRLDYGFLEEIYLLGIQTGMSLAIRVDDYTEARDVLEKHRHVSCD